MVFLSNDSLAYEKIRQKNPQYQLDNNRRLISIKIKLNDMNLIHIDSSEIDDD